MPPPKIELPQLTRSTDLRWDWAAVERLEAAADRIDPNAVALILQTSGTTATPQGVMLTHGGLYENAAAKLASVPQCRTDRRLTLLPLAHAYARTCDFGTWLIAGGQLAIGQGWDRWQSFATPLRPTLLNAVPALADRLLGDPRSADLRLLGCGGAAMNPVAFAAWKNRGVTVIQGYGLTEAGPCVCSATPGDGTAGCVGRPVPGVAVRVRNGELLVRGPGVMAGYDGDPNMTADKFTNDNWLKTGDEAVIDQTRKVRILGRIDDVIALPNGYKIHPGGIEHQIAQRCDVSRIVLLCGPDMMLIVAYETAGASCDERVRAAAGYFLPAGIEIRCVRLDPPVGERPGELSGKGTVRRDVVAGRLLIRSM